MIAIFTAASAVCSFGAAYYANQIFPVRPVQVEMQPTGVVHQQSSVGGAKKDLPPLPLKSRIVHGAKGF